MRLYFILQELRLDRLAEQDVRQSEVIDVDEHAPDHVVERREPVERDARQAHEGCLHDDRARGRCRHIRKPHERIAVLVRELDFCAVLCHELLDERLIRGGRDRQEEFRPGALGREQFRRLEHGGQQHLDLLAAAARHQEHGVVTRRDAKECARLRLGDLCLDRIDERVPEERDVGAGCLVDGQLVWEDRDEGVGERRALLRAALAPGPGRRRDVREDGDAELLGALREAPVEVRVIDEDEEVRALLLHVRRQVVEEPEDAPEVLDDLPDAHDIVVREIAEELHTRALHARSAKADELGIGCLLEHGAREALPVQVARHLAG